MPPRQPLRATVRDTALQIRDGVLAFGDSSPEMDVLPVDLRTA